MVLIGYEIGIEGCFGSNSRAKVRKTRFNFCAEKIQRHNHSHSNFPVSDQIECTETINH